MKLRILPLALAALAACAAHAQLKPPPIRIVPGNTPAAPSLAPSTAPAPAPAQAAAGDPEKEKAGQNAAHAWLLLLDRRDWGTAWETSSAMFRQAVPLGTWMDNIPPVRASFGNFVEREPVETAYKTTLAGRPDGDYVSVIFQSRFDKKPSVQEIVTTVREPDGRWRVTGYTYQEQQ